MNSSCVILSTLMLAGILGNRVESIPEKENHNRDKNGTSGVQQYEHNAHTLQYEGCESVNSKTALKESFGATRLRPQPPVV
ncbi:hypothetical protein Pan54_47650 [Rubinisphaera italica]|uniref:Uncharacterized protein n=1 Tax=Rubinisphaera italica TaxID=2527969 RepID=A0A5C5XPL3_9PLAN|nr:hypothetical protein Pan54_47650 [Rubinisphaera italica]